MKPGPQNGPPFLSDPDGVPAMGNRGDPPVVVVVTRTPCCTGPREKKEKKKESKMQPQMHTHTHTVGGVGITPCQLSGAYYELPAHMESRSSQLA